MATGKYASKTKTKKGKTTVAKVGNPAVNAFDEIPRKRDKRSGTEISKRSTKTSPGTDVVTTNPGLSSPVFEAYWLVLNPASLAQQHETAKKLVASIFTAGGFVEALNEAEPDAEFHRAFLISSSSAAQTPSDVAWGHARDLQASPGVLDAEPLFAVAGLEPDPVQISALLAPYERRQRTVKKALNGDKVLGCAMTNSIWHLEMINAPEAWLLKPPAGGARFGEGIVIGHPDTGYTRHDEIWEDTSPRRLYPERGYNFEENIADPIDRMNGQAPGHGTATASVISSARGGLKRPFVTGSAPESTLIPIRVSNSVIHLISFKNVIKAIYHAVDKANAHVISMSLGGPLHSSGLKEAIRHATDNGVIVLAAAGNVWPFVVYPAKFDQVIAVAACNCQRKPWSKSASGDDVDISAPGESVWRAKSEKRLDKFRFTVEPSSGTSYAVATVAGACATWLAFHGRDALIARYGPSRLWMVFRELLLKEGFDRPDGWDADRYGVGIINLLKLLCAPLPQAPRAVKRAARRIAVNSDDFVTVVTGLLPDDLSSKVRAEVAALLHPRPRTRNALKPSDSRASATAKGRSAGIEAEFAFHVATNAAVREALYRNVSARTRKVARKAVAHKPLRRKSTALHVELASVMKMPSTALRKALARE